MVCILVTQHDSVLSYLLSLSLCHSMDCSLPSSFVHGNSPEQDYWSEFAMPSSGILPTQGLNPVSGMCYIVKAGSLPFSGTWEALLYILTSCIFEKNSAVRRTANFKVHCQFCFLSFHFHTFLHYQLFPSSVVCNILSLFLFSFCVIIFYVTMPRLFICFFLNDHFGCFHFGILRKTFSQPLI